MGKNRPIVMVTLGYIIGIIWGLYLKTNIVSFYIFLLLFWLIAKLLKKPKAKGKFKFISIQKILRYIKLIFNFKSIIIIIIFSSISNYNLIHLNNKYENIYSNLEKVNIKATIVDNGKNKEYKTTYKIKVDSYYFYLDVKNNLKVSLKYGDYITLQGEYKAPSKPSNFGGFDYSSYLKTLKIYGTIEAEKIAVLKENSNNILFTISNNIFLKIKDNLQKQLPEDQANILLGILLGDKKEIPEEIQEDFKQGNISHILAVSGLHVTYIILFISKIAEKICGKRLSKIITIFFIIAYMFITKFTPSVVRAGIMGIIVLLAKLTHNKNDIWTSIAISLLITLTYNPHLIISAGIQLSYGGTIGIILFNKTVNVVLKRIRIKSRKYRYKKHIKTTNSLIKKIIPKKYKINIKIAKLLDYVIETVSVSISASLVITPIMARMFNSVSLSFFISNFFVSLIIGPIIILGIIFIILDCIKFSIISILIKFIIQKLLVLLILISKMGKSLPFSKINIATPELWEIAIYYIGIFVLNTFLIILSKRKITIFEKRLINWKNLIKHLARKNHKKIIAISLCVAILIISIKIMPQDLKIYFIDVGQGDSTLLVTPRNKTILIDGGGSENYDIGKNILLPYLLDRKITQIDYVVISHFDTDHVRGIIVCNAKYKSGKCNYFKTSRKF